MKTTKTKKCETCYFYNALYQKTLYRFWREPRKFYYCILLEKFTESENECAYGKKKTKEYDLSPQRFDQVEEDIAFLLEQFKDS